MLKSARLTNIISSPGFRRVRWICDWTDPERQDPQARIIKPANSNHTELVLYCVRGYAVSVSTAHDWPAPPHTERPIPWNSSLEKHVFFGHEKRLNGKRPKGRGLSWSACNWPNMKRLGGRGAISRPSHFTRAVLRIYFCPAFFLAFFWRHIRAELIPPSPLLCYFYPGKDKCFARWPLEKNEAEN